MPKLLIGICMALLALAVFVGCEFLSGGNGGYTSNVCARYYTPADSIVWNNWNPSMDDASYDSAYTKMEFGHYDTKYLYIHLEREGIEWNDHTICITFPLDFVDSVRVHARLYREDYGSRGIEIKSEWIHIADITDRNLTFDHTGRWSDSYGYRTFFW